MKKLNVALFLCAIIISQNSLSQSRYFPVYLFECDYDASVDSYRAVIVFSQVLPYPGSENGLTAEQWSLATIKLRKLKLEDKYGDYLSRTNKAPGRLNNCIFSWHESESVAEKWIARQTASPSRGVEYLRVKSPN